jgi:hypothetical protein
VKPVKFADIIFRINSKNIKKFGLEAVFSLEEALFDILNFFDIRERK